MKEKITITVLIITIVGLIIYFNFSESSVSHSEILKLNQDCKKIAYDFVEEKKPDWAFESNFSVLHTIYNVERKSCFGEFDLSVKRPGNYFSEYRIYDLVTGANIISLTYLEEHPDEYFHNEYFPEKSEEYYQIREDIFGLSPEQY